MERKIGPYTIVERLGKGGMGEVYLAKDPLFSRCVALKRIRTDLKKNGTIRKRFLREAKVMGALSHPSILPILSIDLSEESTYYTMPVIEGETLRQIFQKTREAEKKGADPHPVGSSIPSLCRIFVQVGEAIAYTHSKGILHRDVKPENIILGKYGEVIVLDWGIAVFIGEGEDEEGEEGEERGSFTKPGKITGTVSYMAPERMRGEKSSFQTDIYALGVILYQMLTLQLPFHRKSLALFRKNVDKEEWIDPIEMAPYRDIPHALAAVCKKCLAKDPKERYQTVGELLLDVKKYMEGRPEWVWMGELYLEQKKDWQFQENILLARHSAISQFLDVTDWMAYMVSKQSFFDTLRIETTLQVQKDSQGVGFLFSIPDPDEKGGLEEGYCIWLGTAAWPGSRLFRRNVEVLYVETSLEPLKEYAVRIEKTEEQIKLFLDDKLIMNFTSYLPLVGKHVGFLHKDAAFQIDAIRVYGGSFSAQVGCLAVPNAFFSRHLYDAALQEYRRIGQSFPGRSEGREALFRAGVTLLEKGKKEPKCISLALEEFSHLKGTSGAPLEYLGKALVYEALVDPEEEAKCLELGLRRFKRHPLVSMLREHVVYRMHESSLKNRTTAYHMILLAIRHIPRLLDNPDTKWLLDRLEKNWETLYFMEKGNKPYAALALQLAFWLKKTPILVEMGEGWKGKDPSLFLSAVFALLEIEEIEEVKKLLAQSPYEGLLASLQKPSLDNFFSYGIRLPYFLMKQALMEKKYSQVLQWIEWTQTKEWEKSDKLLLDTMEVWALLLSGQYKLAEKILRKYPSTTLQQETSLLHFPFGTWLYAAKGPKGAMRHFAAVLEVSYPATSALPSYFLTKKIGEKGRWLENAFWWEKKALYEQLSLFYSVVGKEGDGEAVSAIYQK